MEWNNTNIYPVEPWTVTEEGFSAENNYRNETTFALSNGYIGTRGTYEEGYGFPEDQGLEGNFINGFYESGKIRYGEWNYGFPEESQSLLNLPNLKQIRLFVDGEEFDMRQGGLIEAERTLHMDRATVSRRGVWESRSGKQVEIETGRLVSFRVKNLMEQVYRVTPLNFEGELAFVSTLQADVENHTRRTNPLVDYGPFGRRLKPDALTADGGFLYYEGTTKGSRLTMACACGHRLIGAGGRELITSEASPSRLFAQACIRVPARRGETVVLEKQIAYASCLEMERERLRPFLEEVIREAGDRGWVQEEAWQKRYMDGLWRGADIVIRGDTALQQGLRFNLFHVMQAAGRDGRTGMGAKGLSGEGYEGHYFWDTEMYVLPFFIYTNPQLAKPLLSYRFHTLDAARERAGVLGHGKGALYPWRTINGREASTYYPLGTAQYHINADIAYAFKLYVDVTGDMDFLKEQAAEVLIETARVWADVGCFAESKGGKYCICAVTGPDEYNAIVDNNFYTNLMARENLRAAVWALDTLKEIDPGRYEHLWDALKLEPEEPELWERIIENMYFPYDERRRVYPLDDGFLMRKPWDESKIPPEKRHLLYENYHPLFIFRQRMSKQADAILGMYLHSQLFTQEELKRNYDFYQEVTLHHSSLSTCIFGILACRIGEYGDACRYFNQSVRMDLDDYHGNFYAGIHAANMAGSWQAVVNGFAGLRMNGGIAELSPYLPEGWEGYEFPLRIGGSSLRVSADRVKTAVTLTAGKPVELRLFGELKKLERVGDRIEQEV